MIKILHLLFCSLFVAACLIACSDEEPDFIGKIPYLELSQTTYEFDASEQDIQVSFFTNQKELFFDEIWNEYLIIGETQPRPCDWITQTSTRVKVSEHTYTFHVEANKSLLPRKAMMPVWAGKVYSDRGLLKFVHFVQKGAEQ